MDLVIRGRMDLVIRGRSQDRRGARTRGGPTRQDRTRGRGMTGEAGRDQRAWDDRRGVRQDGTRGRGRT